MISPKETLRINLIVEIPKLQNRTATMKWLFVHLLQGKMSNVGSHIFQPKHEVWG